jgi:hypothetical protein
MTSVDLFGDPPAPAPAPAVSVNDMDQVQTVLDEVADEKTPVLHRDEAGGVTRCRPHGTASVADEVAALVNQLIGARYLTTTRRHRRCTGADHGPVVTTTLAGRNALHRWNAYRRPASWGPRGGRVDAGAGAADPGVAGAGSSSSGGGGR